MVLQDREFESWSKAHVFYNLFFEAEGGSRDKAELRWRINSFKKSACGGLLLKNHFFEDK